MSGQGIEEKSIFVILLIMIFLITGASFAFSPLLFNGDNDQSSRDDDPLFDLNVGMEWNETTDPVTVDYICFELKDAVVPLYNITVNVTLDENTTFNETIEGPTENWVNGSFVQWIIPDLLVNETECVKFTVDLNESLMPGDEVKFVFVATANDTSQIEELIEEVPGEDEDDDDDEDDQEDDLRGYGFWKHQFKANLEGKGHAHVNESTLDHYILVILNMSEYFSTVRIIDDMEAGHDLLTDKNNKEMRVKAEKHFYCTWLNLVSGAINESTPLDTGGNETGNGTFSTVGEFMDWAEDQLLDPDADKDTLETLKDVAEGINEGKYV